MNSKDIELFKQIKQLIHKANTELYEKYKYLEDKDYILDAAYEDIYEDYFRAYRYLSPAVEIDWYEYLVKLDNSPTYDDENNYHVINEHYQVLLKYLKDNNLEDQINL